jgi:hypothetical protein
MDFVAAKHARVEELRDHRDHDGFHQRDHLERRQGEFFHLHRWQLAGYAAVADEPCEFIVHSS